MTADGIADAVGWKARRSLKVLTESERIEPFRFLNYSFWCLTLFCGFLVLATSMASTADGVLRRWVDVCWTALPWLRKWDTKHIGKLYFSVLCIYAAMGIFTLWFVKGDALITYSTIMYNYALGFSSLHVAAINTVLLPPQLRPTRWRRMLLVMGGVFFLTAAAVSTTVEGPKMIKQFKAMMNPPAATLPATTPSAASPKPAT